MITDDRTHLVPTLREVALVVSATFFILLSIELAWTGSGSKIKMLAYECLTVLPAMVFVIGRKYAFREVFRWRRVGSFTLLASGLIGLGLSVVVDELDSLIQIILPMPDVLLDGLNEMMQFETPGEFILLFLAVVVVAGIAEELLFRGFIQGALERRLDVTRAVLLSALFFAVLHINPWWFVQILILGFVLGILAWRSQSIAPGIVVHVVNNSIAFALMNSESQSLTWYRVEGHIAPVWIVAGVVCIALGFRLFFQLTQTLVETPAPG